MRSRRRRKYRRRKSLERQFAALSAEFGLTCPRKYRSIQLWLRGFGILPFYSRELGEEFKETK